MLADPVRAEEFRLRKNRANARRYERLGVSTRSIDNRKVFEEDGWICRLCWTPVDPTLAYPDPDSASLDHVIALDDGGRHERANVQCSHLRCNIAKARQGQRSIPTREATDGSDRPSAEGHQDRQYAER